MYALYAFLKANSQKEQFLQFMATVPTMEKYEPFSAQPVDLIKSWKKYGSLPNDGILQNGLKHRICSTNHYGFYQIQNIKIGPSVFWDVTILMQQPIQNQRDLRLMSEWQV